MFKKKYCKDCKHCELDKSIDIGLVIDDMDLHFSKCKVSLESPESIDMLGIKKTALYFYCSVARLDPFGCGPWARKFVAKD